MKILKIAKISSLLAFLWLGFATPGKACDMSTFTLTGWVESPTGTWTITTSLCVGYGRTGVAFGADGPTGVFFNFAIFGAVALATPANPAGPLVSWAPATVTGPVQLTEPACVAVITPTYTSAGGQVGAGNCSGEVDNIVYYHPTFSVNYTCITTTACCGAIGAWCKTFTFVYKGSKPDSITAQNIEGLVPGCGAPTPGVCPLSGVPLIPRCGCYRYSDMSAILLGVLPVTWQNFIGYSFNDGVNLGWSTSQEKNSKYFSVIRRGGDANEFTEIGQVKASGDASYSSYYKFFDPNPEIGANQYRLVSYNQDGKKGMSEVIDVNYTPPTGIAIKSIFPNPARGSVTLEVHSENAKEAVVSIFNLPGQKQFEMPAHFENGVNSKNIDISSLSAGIYILKVTNAEGTIQQKFVVQ